MVYQPKSKPEAPFSGMEKLFRIFEKNFLFPSISVMKANLQH